MTKINLSMAQLTQTMKDIEGGNREKSNNIKANPSK
jgi:hypothetical protein